jgi:hypothetical protein
MKKKTRIWSALSTKLPYPDIARLYEGYRRHASYTICLKVCRSAAVTSRASKMYSSAFLRGSTRLSMFASPPKNSSLPAIQSSRSVASKKKLEKLASRLTWLSLMSGRSVRDISNDCELLLIQQCSRVYWKVLNLFQLSSAPLSTSITIASEILEAPHGTAAAYDQHI